MNVAFDPWIPVVTMEGKPKLASLCEVLTEGDKLADLAVRPHERVALMRLLLCVAHAALNGPRNYEEWEKVAETLPSSAAKYLDHWRESFELFHPTNPWLQIAGLEPPGGADGEWTTVAKLTFAFATGDNSTLFDHEGLNEERSIRISDLIVSMLSFQCFATCGLLPKAQWNGTVTAMSAKDAPCVSSSMLHMLIRGANVLSTIWMNLPSHEDLASVYGARPVGRPIWEKMPSMPEDVEAAKNATETYVGRLVPLCRFIKLDPRKTRMLMGEGFRYPTHADGFPQEPTATVIAKDDERVLVGYRLGRAVWRELAAIALKRSAEGIGGPLALSLVPDDKDCDVVVSALSRVPGQKTIVDSAESVYHLPSRLRQPRGNREYESQVQFADKVSNKLAWAIEEYRKAIDGGWEGRVKGAGPKSGELKAKLRATALTHYWTLVEKDVGLLLIHIAGLESDRATSTRDEWHKLLWRCAREAYRTACAQETPRQMKAFTEGWDILHRNPKDENVSSAKATSTKGTKSRSPKKSKEAAV